MSRCEAVSKTSFSVVHGSGVTYSWRSSFSNKENVVKIRLVITVQKPALIFRGICQVCSVYQRQKETSVSPKKRVDVHGGRSVLYLKVAGNNRVSTVLQSFIAAVEQYGLPSDKCGQDSDVAEFMIRNKGDNGNITG